MFRKAKTFRGDASFATWLHRLTVNACHDLLRRRKRHAQPTEQTEAVSPDQSSSTLARLVVEEALAGLPYDQKVAVVMRDLYGLTYQEISLATGVPSGTVKSRIARGRSALALALREPGAEEIRLSGMET